VPGGERRRAAKAGEERRGRQLVGREAQPERDLLHRVEAPVAELEEEAAEEDAARLLLQPVRGIAALGQHAHAVRGQQGENHGDRQQQRQSGPPGTMKAEQPGEHTTAPILRDELAFL